MDQVLASDAPLAQAISHYRALIRSFAKPGHASDAERDLIWQEIERTIQIIERQNATSIAECIEKLQVALDHLDETDRDVRSLIESALADLRRLAPSA